MDDRFITLAHGNGGRLMRELIDSLFAKLLNSPTLDTNLDAATIPLPADEEVVTSVDGFTVQPLIFPGGDIGSLAVNGTVNDLAVAGATPRFLTLSAVIEEGLEIKTLRQIIESFAKAAAVAGVEVVAGDTKVVPRGSGGGLYLTTTGIGSRPRDISLGMNLIQPGDRLVVSGPVGDHGIAVMLAREAFDLKGDVRSDCGCVLPFTLAARELPGLRFMRDPTRGGLATIGHELAIATGFDIALEEASIPLRDEVTSVCQILGYDPYFLACEGRVVAIADGETADEIARRWQALEDGEFSSVIGTVLEGPSQGQGRVLLNTHIGGQRVIGELEDDPLPRIC
jgi:hydrogenase expression/formation protein HypE